MCLSYFQYHFFNFSIQVPPPTGKNTLLFENLYFLPKHANLHAKMGKGKIIAGVTSQFYHRGYIIAVITSQAIIRLQIDILWILFVTFHSL